MLITFVRGSALQGAEVDVGALVAVDEPERVVEVVGTRHEVGMTPDRVSAGHAAAGLEQRPQCGCVAQPSRPQLETDQRREGLLRRPAGRDGEARGDQRVLVARRRRIVSLSGATDSSVGVAAARVTVSTQPSTRASNVSSRASAACCSGVGDGWNKPSVSACCSDVGSLGSTCRDISSSCEVSTAMPSAYPRTSSTSRGASHGA